MSDVIAIHLRDRLEPLVEAWTREFAGVDSVTASCGDIFKTEPGPIETGGPIDIKADAVVSPANSFGFMDGGIDMVYSRQFGWGLQERLQELIQTDCGGELPVGQAAIVSTEHPDIPWCISAPTMRVPRDVSQTVNAYLAFRAALRAVLDHNERGRPRISSIVCPGLGTAVGRMPIGRCAKQMRVAWDRVLGSDDSFPPSIGRAVDDEFDLFG